MKRRYRCSGLRGKNTISGSDYGGGIGPDKSFSCRKCSKKGPVSIGTPVKIVMNADGGVGTISFGDSILFGRSVY